MPRIRTIKPEFWDSPSTARASAVARLAFIAMWNWADDHGRGTANLKELEGFIFPNDDIAELSGGRCRKFRDVVAEVSEAFGVVFYTVKGRPYYAIPTWTRHQRNERSASAKYPGPDEADRPVTSGNTDEDSESRSFRDGAAELPTTSGPGTGEQGNRGTERTRPSADADDQAFDQWWTLYPRKVKKDAARRAFKAALKRATLEDLIGGLRKQLPALQSQMAKDPQFVAHPSTWLNSGSWADEPVAVQTERVPSYWRGTEDPT